ncbi:carboxymuconolactone decarboxylase family protein [Alsobacter sp. SYSU M60028]|uniref:Carboxymuconolactone decarboxylase family protein n=1 Tax=Alsobacter ponti TaxID=2962936 RepID=A0ABT1LGM8_9HYPH|nr:carboxymuconolactone decarboxylase family protein [Alsobacter ponti]MCP8939408.1 carboxymuconolactone decarboxylase family protein [Alsobacter ponti]
MEKPSVSATDNGLWGPALDILREWDPSWARSVEVQSLEPWRSGVLSRKLVELIGVGLNAACTNLNREGLQRHMRAALDAGATRGEILLVLKCAAVMAVHSCSLGSPLLLEEAKAAGIAIEHATDAPTPACDGMKAAGQWNVAWDPFLALDPAWTDAFMAVGIGVYTDSSLTAREIELLSIAVDASFTHMYAPGTRRHIAHALKAGATPAEIMAVLKLCVSQGYQALNLGLPMLAEELARRAAEEPSPAAAASL